MKTTLGDLALTVKSANAGAAWVTFDIAMPDAKALEVLVASGALEPASIAKCLKTEADDVRVFVLEKLSAVKISIPRRQPRCGQTERDFDGVQQFVPLLGLEVTL